MLTTVLLHGELGRRFGRRWEFHVRTPYEAIAALECARPGFRKAVLEMTKHVFRVRVGSRYVEGKHLPLPANGKTIAITPVLEYAANSKGWLQVVAGVVLVAAGIALMGTPLGVASPYLIGYGIGFIVGGIATLLAPSPPGAGKETRNEPSYIFDGAVNAMRQGLPVPLAYGEPFTGSDVVSADVSAADIERGSAAGGGNGTGTGSSNNGANSPATPVYDNEARSQF